MLHIIHLMSIYMYCQSPTGNLIFHYSNILPNSRNNLHCKNSHMHSYFHLVKFVFVDLYVCLCVCVGASVVIRLSANPCQQI